MRTTKDWKLPVPEETEDGFDWQPVVRVGRTVPLDTSKTQKTKIFFAHSRRIKFVRKAKKYLKQYSYRDVSNWLSEQSGRYISHVGLMKRVKLEQKRKREASNQRYLAQRYKEALEKAEKIEATRFGARDQGTRTTEA